MDIIKIIFLLFAIFLVVGLFNGLSHEHFYLYDDFNNVYDLPDDLVKRYWQRYPKDRLVSMNF